MNFWTPIDYINKLIDKLIDVTLSALFKKDKDTPITQQRSKSGVNIIINSVKNLNISNNSTQENADQKIQEEYEEYAENVLININE